MVSRSQKGNGSPVIAKVHLGPAGSFARAAYDGLVSQVGECGLNGNPFRAVVFNLTAHCPYLDAFQDTVAQSLRVGDSDLIGQLCGLGISIF